VSVAHKETETERSREKITDTRERERERESVCVCVCVCEREKAERQTQKQKVRINHHIVVCVLSCINYTCIYTAIQDSQGRGWKQSKTQKNDKSFWYQTQGSGRMAQTPQAGTVDSTCRIRRCRCSIVLTCQGNLFMCSFFLDLIALSSGYLGITSNPKKD